MFLGKISVFSKGSLLGTTFRVEIPMTRYKKNNGLNISLSSKLSKLCQSGVKSFASTANVTAVHTPCNFTETFSLNNTSDTSVSYMLNLTSSIRSNLPLTPTMTNRRHNKEEMHIKAYGKSPSNSLHCNDVFSFSRSHLNSSSSSVGDSANTVEIQIGTDSSTSVQVSLANNCNFSQGGDVVSSTISKSMLTSTDNKPGNVLSSKGGRSLHALIVDDSDVNRKMLTRLMLREGHTCEYAVDGFDAVQKIEQKLNKQFKGLDHDNTIKSLSTQASTDINLFKTDDGIAGNQLEDQQFDVILMDSMMPNMEGPEATTEILKLGYKGKIFGVTGNALKVDVDRFLAAGVVRVLIKPVSASILNEVFHGKCPVVFASLCNLTDHIFF